MIHMIQELFGRTLKNLGAQSDLAPLPRTRNFGAGRACLRDGVRRHASSAVAQEHDDPATFLFESLQCRVNRMGSAEHVVNDVSAMQSRQHVLAVANATVN